MALHPARQIRKGGLAAFADKITLRVLVDRVLPVGAVVIVKRDGEVLGNATSIGPRTYELLDTTAPADTVVQYTACVTNGSYVGPDCSVYPVSTPPAGEGILMETSGFILMESGGNILLEDTVDPGPDPDPSIIFRDDFNGVDGVNGRVPNITDSGNAWAELAIPSNMQTVLTGSGEAQTNGIAGQTVGDIKINTTAAEGLSFKCSMYAAEHKLWGASGTSTVLYVKIRDATNYINFILYDSTDVSAAMNLPEENINVGAHVWGSGGSTVEIEFLWLQDYAEIWVNGDLILTSTQPVPPPSGAGSVEIAMTSGNYLEYAQLERLVVET